MSQRTTLKEQQQSLLLTLETDRQLTDPQQRNQMKIGKFYRKISKWIIFFCFFIETVQSSCCSHSSYHWAQWFACDCAGYTATPRSICATVDKSFCEACSCHCHGYRQCSIQSFTRSALTSRANTWSLFGCECDAAVIRSPSRRASENWRWSYQRGCPTRETKNCLKILIIQADWTPHTNPYRSLHKFFT